MSRQVPDSSWVRYRVSVGLELIEGAGPDAGSRPFDPLSLRRRSGSSEDY